MKLTLCDKVLIGNIPNFNIEDKDELLELISYWIELKDSNKSVFVCFQSWEERTGVHRDEIQEFFISHKKEQVECFSESIINNINKLDIDYSIFEFESYEEAFKYCTDLTQGF